MTAPVMERIRKRLSLRHNSPQTLNHRSDATLLLHIAIHCYGKDLSVIAIENCRYVQFSVIALYFGNVGKQLLKRFFRFKVPFDQIFAVLDLLQPQKVSFIKRKLIKLPVRPSDFLREGRTGSF